MVKKTKYPIAYELTPQRVEPGVRWVMLHLENVGDVDLKSLSVNLNSLDAYSIDVHGTGAYLEVLRRGEEQALPYQVTVRSSGMVYATLEGWQGDVKFRWESLGMTLRGNEEVAELVRFFALTEPYPLVGTPLHCEAVIQGNRLSEELVIEFWVETPGGELLSVAKMGTERLEAGEEDRYDVEFTPEEEGLYTFHAYLYDGARRIGHQIDYVSATA
jgi:hypothetical protein